MSEQAEWVGASREALAKPGLVLNTEHARAMLRKRHAAPEWALMEEVAPGTGGGTRYADAIAINLWQSRGHAIHGFEIKVSRSDWLRELKNPSKAEALYRYCDHWHILAPKGIVKDGELPATWGLLELRAAGIVQVVAAPKLTPAPVSREFFASIVRRAHEGLSALAESMHRQGLAEAHEAIDRQVAERVERATHRHQELLKTIAEFEKSTGLKLSTYAGPAVRTIKLAVALQKLDGWREETAALGQLIKLAKQLDCAAETVRNAVQATGLRVACEEAAST